MCDCSLHLGDRFLRKVSSSLSFEHDVRTFFFGGTIQEAGAERERERESQMGRIRRPTRTRLIITVRKNQMVLQRHNQVNLSDCGDGSHFNVLVVAISLSLSIFQ